MSGGWQRWLGRTLRHAATGLVVMLVLLVPALMSAAFVAVYHNDPATAIQLVAAAGFLLIVSMVLYLS